MAPRGKKNVPSKRGNAVEIKADPTSPDLSSSLPASSATASRSSSRRSKATTVTTTTVTRSTRRSTQNATNLTPKPEVSNELILDMSEDSDFEAPQNGGPSTPKVHHTKGTTTTSSATSTVISPNAKKRSAEETQSSSKSRQKQKKLIKQDSDVDMIQAPIKEEEGIEFSAPGSGSDVGSEFLLSEDQSSEDEEEWEEVPISALNQGHDREDYDDEEELSGPWQYNAVEIVFDRPLNEIKKKSKNKGVTKEERMIRVLIHQTHLLCLIANGLRRNRWISHAKLCSLALSLVPGHIAESVQAQHENPSREINALQVLALWWRDSFVVTGPGIQHQEYMDLDVVGAEAVFPTEIGECIKQRKKLQRKLLNRNGSTDVCSQLFTAICRSLGLKARLVESLQACSFKISLAKEELASSVKNEVGSSSSKLASRKGKKKEVELDENDTTRGSKVVLHTPHRLTKKPASLPHNHKSAENYVTDVTRRYTSAWTTTTKKLRVQPAGSNGFDWWTQTMSGLMNPHRTIEEDLEEEELLKAEVSERMPTKLGDFNNHPLYALERHLKKFEVLHPRIPILGHIRGEAVFPRSCVKQVRSKENWLKRGRVIKGDEVKPIKWVKSHAATIFQMRLRQQIALSGERRVGNSKGATRTLKQRSIVDDDNDDDDIDEIYRNEGSEPAEGAEEIAEGDKTPLFGEWQTEAYQPPWVIDGKVPRNQYGRQDVFTPDMVPIGGTHLKGRGIGKVARLLGVDYVEAVTGFEFQSRKSVPVVQGVIVPTEQAELVLDAYYEIEHQRNQEAHKKKRTEALKRWRKLIKGVLIRARLIEEYGDANKEDEQDGWAPEDDDEGGDDGGEKEQGGAGDKERIRPDQSQSQTVEAEAGDSGAGFMLD
ncbi:hypothetical protein BGX27_010777 [Mortierella sp. AM989]|nr:hypothetical protein BGX27_010777 [Mortierella sp. AM989]